MTSKQPVLALAKGPADMSGLWLDFFISGPQLEPERVNRERWMGEAGCDVPESASLCVKSTEGEGEEGMQGGTNTKKRKSSYARRGWGLEGGAKPPVCSMDCQGRRYGNHRRGWNIGTVRGNHPPRSHQPQRSPSPVSCI